MPEAVEIEVRFKGGLPHLVDGRSDQILYLLPGPNPAGLAALRLSALEFLDRVAKILPPPRIHRHRYHGVFAPNAPLRPLVKNQKRPPRNPSLTTSTKHPVSIPSTPNPFQKTILIRAGTPDLSGSPARLHFPNSLRSS